MAFENKKPFIRWDVILAAKVNELCEKFGMDDLMTSETRDFVIGIAREQFKGGIVWARKNPPNVHPMAA